MPSRRTPGLLAGDDNPRFTSARAAMRSKVRVIRKPTCDDASGVILGLDHRGRVRRAGSGLGPCRIRRALPFMLGGQHGGLTAADLSRLDGFPIPSIRIVRLADLIAVRMLVINTFDILELFR